MHYVEEMNMVLRRREVVMEYRFLRARYCLLWREDRKGLLGSRRMTICKIYPVMPQILVTVQCSVTKFKYSFNGFRVPMNRQTESCQICVVAACVDAFLSILGCTVPTPMICAFSLMTLAVLKFS